MPAIKPPPPVGTKILSGTKSYLRICFMISKPINKFNKVLFYKTKNK